MKVLTLAQALAGRLDSEDLEKRESSDQWPRTLLFEKKLNADMFDERFIHRVPPFRKMLYAKLPMNVAQVMEAFIIKNRYDAVISWAEILGLPFAALLKITFSRKPHVGIFSWISKPKKARVLKMVQSHFDRIVLMSTAQRDFAVHALHIPSEKVALLHWPVDLKYWRPMGNVPNKIICSVGREMRDYGTLIKALEGTGIRCHIAAGGLTNGDKKDAWLKDVSGNLPSNITVGKKNYTELRSLYAESMFVVIPLFPTDTDNGTTSILEAMAMGKAVICTKVDGQRDVIRDGVNGIFVPPNDPKALREAIEFLTANPDIANRMGLEGRKFVEQYHSLDMFVESIGHIVQESVEAKSTHRGSRRKKHKKAITIISSGIGRPTDEEIRAQEQADEIPHIMHFEETIDSDILDERFLRSAPAIRKMIYKFLPVPIAQTLEAYAVRKKYNAVITWSARNVLPYAFLSKLTFSKHPHIALMSWVSGKKKEKLLKLTRSHIDRLVVWSSVQRNFAVNVIGFPSEKVVLVSRRADVKFWRPMEGEKNTICAVGQEMRDYPTLIKALNGLDIPCHIATGEFYGKLHDTVKVIDKYGKLPPNITVGRLENKDLRLLYARSKFVVIPLLLSDTDNGVTAIEESMAMGKAVICSRTMGQVDIIQEGKTGIFVPVGDSEALREAILYLWNNPEKAEEMGRNGREYITKNHSLEKFVNDVNSIVDDVIKEKKVASPL
jgi:glycosyltransferase involved in cell wall biosynthesis